MDSQRYLRQRVDDLFRGNKTRQFTLEEIAHELSVGGTALMEASHSIIRCPFTKCQSFDTTPPENVGERFLVHHCNRCERDFHVEHDSKGYSILGWYGE
jgi:hypothetical protein